MSAEFTLTLSEGLQAPAHARAWVNQCTSHLPREVVEDALLIVSELVTNAVRHGGEDVQVTLQVPGDEDPYQSHPLRIDVHDDGDQLPIVPSAQPSVDRPTGRGLLIVAATAADWGVDRTSGHGKTVWATVEAGGTR